MRQQLYCLERFAASLPRWICFLVAITITLGSYLGVNHFHFFPKFDLPMTWLDANIPFVEWSAIIYFSAFVMAWLAIMLIPQSVFGRTATVGGCLVFVHILIFLLFPTEYPRPDHVRSLLNWFYIFDTPYNCFPSLHISGPIFYTLILWRYRSRQCGIIFAVWSILIAISTLTTKQHYTIDLLGSLFFSTAAYLIVRKTKP